MCCLASLASRGSRFVDTTKTPAGLELNVHLGYLLPHHPEIKSLLQKHPKALGVSLVWPCPGDKVWHQAFRGPRLGIETFVADLGNVEQLGWQISGSGFAELPLATRRRLSQWLKLGVGMGFTTKQWDLYENNKATVIGSKLSAALSLQYGIETRLSDAVHLKTGVRFTHFSNGSFALPNLGSNVASLFVGLNYGQLERRSLDRPPTFSAKNSFAVYGGFGLKEVLPPLGKKYGAYVVSTTFDRRVDWKTGFGAVVDVFYNPSLEPRIIESTGEQPSTSQLFQVGMAGTYTLYFDDWELKMMLGAYVVNDLKKLGWMYNRVMIKKPIGERFFVGLGLKFHKTVAENIELGVGVQLGR
jgi:hypothetical protein